MDGHQATSGVSASPAIAFALGALVVDVAVLVLPWSFGSSLLSSALEDGLPFSAKAANLLMLFSGVVAILIGLVLLRRGRAAVASGVFVGLLVILGLRVIASILVSIDGWVWQTVVILSLQTIECALLFLAARAARQQEM